jgi:hypothetical protein
MRRSAGPSRADTRPSTIRPRNTSGDDAYTNTDEGYFSILKRGVYGVYQHVSEAHLKRYLAEFDFRYSYRIKTGFDDIARTDLAIKGIKGKRLTYRTIGGGRAAQTAAL